MALSFSLFFLSNTLPTAIMVLFMPQNILIYDLDGEEM